MRYSAFSSEEIFGSGTRFAGFSIVNNVCVIFFYKVGMSSPHTIHFFNPRCEIMNQFEDLVELYLSIKNPILSRMEDFRRVWHEGKEEEIFAELVFCLLTPQSNARTCWSALLDLVDKELLLGGDGAIIAEAIRKVRFRFNKSGYIVSARDFFMLDGKISIRSKIAEWENVKETREWLVRNIKGLGFKEASHFLRNIGKGRELAILDRHILRNMKIYGLIGEIPGSLSPKKYREFEELLKDFSTKIGIPLDHLDLVFWYNVKNEIFK